MKLGAKSDFSALATFIRLVLNKNLLFTPYRINYYSKYFMMKRIAKTLKRCTARVFQTFGKAFSCFFFNFLTTLFDISYFKNKKKEFKKRQLLFFHKIQKNTCNETAH